MNAIPRTFILYAIIVLLTVAVSLESRGQGTPQDISFSQFLNEVDQGRVKDVLMHGSEIHGTFADGRTFQTYAPSDPTLIQRLYGKGVNITARPPTDTTPWWVQLILAWLPFVVSVAVYGFLIFFFFRILLRIQRAVEMLSHREKGTV